jgi:hypothetical protein
MRITLMHNPKAGHGTHKKKFSRLAGFAAGRQPRQALSPLFEIAFCFRVSITFGTTILLDRENLRHFSN